MKKLLILLLIFNYSFAQESGSVINANEMNTKFNEYKENLGHGYLPLGAIMPFHKNAANGLAVPEGWVECDGGSYAVEVNGPLDPDGDGQYKVPDLNNQVYAGGRGRYLRGGTQSGNFNASTAWDDNGADYTSGSTGSYYGATFGSYKNTETHSSISSYKNGSTLNPDNYRHQVSAMTVVYIMRIR